MRKFLAVTFAAASLIGAGGAASNAQAQISADNPNLIKVQFAANFWGGRQYCWYDSAWSGPGWYWCGYPWRYGLGWGGPRGWHGWHGGDGHEGGHGGGGEHGGHGGFGHGGFAQGGHGGGFGGGGHGGGFGGGGHGGGFGGGGHGGGGGHR